ncbi:hypothetical protein KIN20_002943 [Parelaphostrongylus tenuis]|uniref:Uncharacterized protein n=1 Tax=Parelaphostrongylus tenuis TaxID=148309 RepID=A0AAD5QI69_PARTN|nr:hypothetical protein KIN20_002943 [Parelaphostrongylus tenuis]
MAASNNKRKKIAGSPAPRQRRFGDKISLYHCNNEVKKLPKKKTPKASSVAEGKAKFAGRKRRISSPSQKENQYGVATVSKSVTNPPGNGNDLNGCLESSFDKGLQLPEVRMVGRLTALRCQPRLTDEHVETEVFIKRHEKLEKEEKQILRRDRIWQNELRIRSHLLRVQQNSPPFRDFRIVLIRRSRARK